MECEFCKSILQSKTSLNNHMKTNKKCLELQSNNSLNTITTLLQCEYCNKNYSKSNLNKHLNICKIKSKITIEKLLSENENFKTDIEKLLNENETLLSENSQLRIDIQKLSSDNKNVQELKNYIIKIETENAIYKKDHETVNNIAKIDHETITNIAKQPKTTTTNNITNKLSVYDADEIKNRFSNAISDIKPADLYDGQKSIGRFVGPCLTNEDGTKMMSCTDYARHIFIRKDSHENINRDVKCKNLADLIEPIASAKAHEMIKEDCSSRIKSFRLASLKKQVIKRQEVIVDLTQHLIGHKNGSSEWKNTIKTISKRENENERDRNEIEILEQEGVKHVDDICDTKLIECANEIREMNKDSSRFSRTVSEYM